MASTVTELMRRRMGSRSASIDWESIARGMVDGTTEFSLPAEIFGTMTATINYLAYGRRNLKSVILPSGITKVGSSSFYDCRGLESVTIPDTLEVIENTGFYYCTSLTEIELPASMTEIELPASMTAINSQAFNYINMATLVIHATTPPTLAANAFRSGYPLKIYVPDNSVAAYKAANNWSTMASRIYPISDLTT